MPVHAPLPACVPMSGLQPEKVDGLGCVESSAAETSRRVAVPDLETEECSEPGAARASNTCQSEISTGTLKRLPITETEGGSMIPNAHLKPDPVYGPSSRQIAWVPVSALPSSATHQRPRSDPTPHEMRRRALDQGPWMCASETDG